MQLKPESATLYRAAISLGAQEAQLIWTRYAGFIIMNGFLVSALSNNEIRQQTIILAVLGLIAFVLNCIWHILNYAGWRYQHLFYRSAGDLFDAEIGLLTDRFRGKEFEHGGWIYRLAQTDNVFTYGNSVRWHCSVYLYWNCSVLGYRCSAMVRLCRGRVVR